jgi:hypothetical protein
VHHSKNCAMMSQTGQKRRRSSERCGGPCPQLGSPGFSDFPLDIRGWNDVTVTFAGSNDLKFTSLSIMGSIDRVTGDMEATASLTDEKTGKTTTSTNYALKCRPTQRMF